MYYSSLSRCWDKLVHEGGGLVRSTFCLTHLTKRRDFLTRDRPIHNVGPVSSFSTPKVLTIQVYWIKFTLVFL